MKIISIINKITHTFNETFQNNLEEIKNQKDENYKINSIINLF